jgi:hypothetical protein
MKKDKSVKEKRQSIRFRIFSLIKHAAESDLGTFQAENIHDVSRGGLAFFTEQEAQKDAVLKLYFLPPNRKKPVEARGKVVWCLKVIRGINVFEVGIQFLNVSDEARLAIEELEASFLKNQKNQKKTRS